MSLINDALKRAKEVHAANPVAPPAHLQFRPIERPPSSGKGFGLVLPATLITIVVVGAISYLGFHDRGETVAKAPAPELTKRSSAAVPPALPAARPAANDAKSVATESAAPTVPAVAESTSSTNSAAPAAAVIAPPKPEPPRLQAIVFSPSRPSAIISGKSVFIGDRVGAFRVSAINPTSATLISATETNVLTME